MTSHELARKLLELPDHPVTLSVYGHAYRSGYQSLTHGGLRLAMVGGSRSPHLAIVAGQDPRFIEVHDVLWKEP